MRGRWGAPGAGTGGGALARAPRRWPRRAHTHAAGRIVGAGVGEEGGKGRPPTPSPPPALQPRVLHACCKGVLKGEVHHPTKNETCSSFNLFLERSRSKYSIQYS